MENPTPPKTCETCSRYERYYTKGATKFERTEFGYCFKQQKIVKNSTCEFWNKKTSSLHFHRISAARSLRAILKHLTALRQIFEESAEEEKQSKPKTSPTNEITAEEKPIHETADQ